MEADINRLLFLDNPQAHQAQDGEVCVHVPDGISSVEELVTVLKDGLGFPEEVQESWYALRDALCNWDMWTDIPQRMVILHTDLPLLHSDRLWWLNVQGYLHALLESIAMFEARKALESDPSKHKELVVIFPSQVYDELYAVLTRPPDWHVSLGFAGYDQPVAYEIDPSWSLIQEYISHLEGPMAEVCSLWREGVGSLVAQYLRHLNAYCLQYTEPAGSIIPFFASEQEQPASWPPTLSLAQVEQSFHQFFTQEKLSERLHWIREPEGHTTGWALRLAHFRGPEEALLDQIVPHDGPIRDVVAQGMREALQEEQAAFDLAYWQQLLKQPAAPLSLRLAAICIVGRSDLPNPADLLRPLLKSSVKQERWVSARFCGLWKDEEALPVLVSMLTDELPFERLEAEGSTLKEQYEKERQYKWWWYDTWRWYAPYLLRPWQIPEVNEQLRQALVIWVKEEPLLRYEDLVPEEEQDGAWQTNLIGISFAAQLCFELGYRGEIVALDELSLGKRYKHDLQLAMQNGVRTRQHSKTALEEYQYRLRKLEPLVLSFLGWESSRF